MRGAVIAPLVARFGPTVIARVALRTLWRSPLRSALMMASAILGVAGVIVSVGFAAGGRQQALDQIRRMGTNVLVVSPRASRSIAGRARTGSPVTTLSEADLVAIRQEVPAITRTSAFVAATFRIKAGDLSKETAVVGCEPNYFRIKSWSIGLGGLFDEKDDRRAGRVVVLGRTVARDLFGSEPPAGGRLTIAGAPFEIVGTLSERGQGLDVGNEDDQVYVPLRTAMRRVMSRDFYNGLLLEVSSWDQMNDAARDIAALLRQRHRTRLLGRPDDFEVSSQKMLAETRLAASERLGFFVRWTRATALVVSGLGILAIGWMTVRARTSEIGTRRALGATRPDIFLQILVEAGTISLLGCLAGLLIGWAASRLVATQSSIPFVFDRSNAAGTLVAAALLNLSFALAPAARAARVSPIRALRFE
jgi:putative ABC transport system permease protein